MSSNIKVKPKQKRRTLTNFQKTQGNLRALQPEDLYILNMLRHMIRVFNLMIDASSTGGFVNSEYI